MDKKKRLITLAAAVLVVIIILILLLRSCGGKKVDDTNPNGGATNTTSTVDDGNGSTIITPDPEDIGYDDELVSTWYKDDKAMVLAENGIGDLYFGDSDGGQIQWYTSGNHLTLITQDKTSVVTYVVDGDDLILTYDNGTVETWFR